MGALPYIFLVFSLCSAILAILSFFIPQKTLKWAQPLKQTRVQGFLFYIVLTIILLGCIGVSVPPHSVWEMSVFTILLVALACYAHGLRKTVATAKDNDPLKNTIEADIAQQYKSSKKEKPIVDGQKTILTPTPTKKIHPTSTPLATAKIEHDDEEQQLRQRNASTCQFLTLDREQKIATFKGSAKEPYITTTNSCTCRDFILRRKPCKHMYKLLDEFGLFNLETTPQGRISHMNYDRSGFDSSRIDALNTDTQMELYGLVRMWIAHNSNDEWLYERDSTIARELISHRFLEEFDNPHLILSHFPIQELRAEIKDFKVDKRRKDNVIKAIIEFRPDFVEEKQKTLMSVRFCETERPLRGQTRSYLKAKFPDAPEVIYEWGTGIEVSALYTY